MPSDYIHPGFEYFLPGVFGAHVANVVRRLSRICAHYGCRPQFICCSATIANPGELAEALTGRKMTLVDDDGSPRGLRYFVFWNPPFLEGSTSDRRSPNTEARRLPGGPVADWAEAGKRRSSLPGRLPAKRPARDRTDAVRRGAG